MNDLFGGVEDTGELHRLFFALWPDTATRHRIAETVSWMKQQGVPRARWSNASFYHLTLEFLGDWPTLPDHVVRRACAAAGDVDAARFDLALDAAGSFNAPTTPWWLGCREAPAPLHALSRALYAKLSLAAVVKRKPGDFVPHVTIARGAGVAMPAPDIPPVAWPVDEFVLIDSVRGARSRYDVLARWPLRGA